MTVSELIEKLKLMPQDVKVILTSEPPDKFDLEVRDVIFNDKTSNRDANTVELDNWPPY